MDKFYTKPEVADTLLEFVKPRLWGYPLVVEPSAGAGNISLRLQSVLDSTRQKLVAVDIAPEHPSIRYLDFLRDSLTELTTATQPALVIGNPPFGRQSNLAISFFNRAAAYPCVQEITFIVPRSWRKPSIQDKLSLQFSLMYEQDLPRNAFLKEGRNHDTPCVMQTWIRSPRPKREKATCNGNYYFVSAPRAPADAICWRRIGGNAGETFFRGSRSGGISAESFYCFKLIDDLHMHSASLVEHLRRVTWARDNVTGPRSISKEELIIELNAFTESLCCR